AALAWSDAPGSPGIAAAIDTPMPARLLWSLYRRVLGPDTVPEFSALDKQMLVWRLMRLLGTQASNPELLPLARYLADDTDLRKRFQLSQRLADLYDQYQVYRSDWLIDWANGRDVLRGAEITRPMSAEYQWQAALWRKILQDVGDEGAESGRAAVHERFLAELRAWNRTEAPDLPRRIIVFGVSSLPRQALEALIEVSRWVQVLICVHNPCEFHWAGIIDGRNLLRQVKRHQPMRPGMPASLDER